MDWIDLYNRFPKLLGSVATLMALVCFAGLTFISAWYLFALVTS